MLAIKSLLPELKKLVTYLADDLLTRSTVKDDPYSTQVDAGLREAYTQIEKGGRTADAFEVWRDDYLDQVAVAWVLACVFVRFMEDNGLVEECWLAGDAERRKLAEDTHELYFREHPHDSDREYFEYVFREVGKIPACRDLFAEGKTPLWAVGPSGDAAMKLLAFWRELNATSGQLKRSFVVENTDTRFLGDLYQDLSERARKKYALLQTPEFVEEFILDKTLEPAIEEFGLDVVRMIDPTCGSGHFLLGAFVRLFDRWMKREDNEIVAAQRALDGVYGVDINPFAVAIARFRLMVAALRACGISKLGHQSVGWKIHVAIGDSLLFGRLRDTRGNVKAVQKFFESDDEGSWAPLIYCCEEHDAVTTILSQQYHVVVGNPPYITPKDTAINKAYRERYSTCHQKYSLSVPFMERFFDLAVSSKLNSESSGSAAGFVGTITANSFMKREFGTKLIEHFLPAIDLTHVIDTSGAYIPGHGTPTVILFGRKRGPGPTIRAVLGIRGEPTTPSEPSAGLVWKSILERIDNCGSRDAFTSSSDISRSVFAKHPWSIGGGGASELVELLQSSSVTLAGSVHNIGFMAITGEDDAFVLTESARRRMKLPYRAYSTGDLVRDWHVNNEFVVVFPYDEMCDPKELQRFFWPRRTTLRSRNMFGKTPEQHGLKWFEYMQFIRERANASLTLVFAFVATHNHFALDRGGKVFNRSAPVIKLSNGSTEADYLALLALLNSSIACFWMKQTFHNKGSTVDQHGARQRTDAFEDFYEFTGTGLLKFPLPEQFRLSAIQENEKLLNEYGAVLADVSVPAVEVPTRRDLELQKERTEALRSYLIALQEEIDWQSYDAYGLSQSSLFCENAFVPPLRLGERAFEIVMARQMMTGELETSWFVRHGSTPITEVPLGWTVEYRSIVERRIEAIMTNKEIALVEKPEYKRRWNTELWHDREERVLRAWLLDCLESTRYWPSTDNADPRFQSVAELADEARADKDFLQVACLYRGRDDFDIALLVKEVVESESVPYLPVLRYKPSGLIKRQVWERTWELQRQEDAGVDVGDNKVPPKYTSADFLSSDFWRLRGKLDVPKERWISYPHCETESDPSLVVGWAGWNHLQQAMALVAYYDARKRDGWDAKRLMPLLAGLDQLLPWIHQWHPEVDPEFGETAGQSFETMLKADAHELGLTLEEIRAWTPPAKAKGARKKAKG